MTETQLPLDQLAAMAAAADEVADQMRRTTRTVEGGGVPSLPGWAVAEAISTAARRWRTKTDHNGSQWSALGARLRTGTEQLSAIDSGNAADLGRIDPAA